MTDMDYFRSLRLLRATRAHGPYADESDAMAAYTTQLCCAKAAMEGAWDANCMNGRLEI